MQSSRRPTDNATNLLFYIHRTCPDYRINPEDLTLQSDRPLGAGANGVVWQGQLTYPPQSSAGQQPPIMTDVAVKILRPRDVRQTKFQFLRSVARELFPCIRLQDKTVVRFIGYCIDPALEHAYLVSEYVRGGCLKGFLRDREACPRLRYRWVEEFTAGVSYLHGCKIVHGDLKTDNLLLDGSGALTLSDFGLATYVGVPTLPNGLTSPESCSGTTRFCSPEILNGERKSTASDVWAWAMTLLEILTGKAPFYAERNETNIVLRIAQHRIPQPDEYPELPEFALFWSLFSLCWREDPRDRVEIRSCLSLVSDCAKGASIWGEVGVKKRDALQRVMQNNPGILFPLEPDTRQVKDASLYISDAVERVVKAAEYMTIGPSWSEAQVSSVIEYFAWWLPQDVEQPEEVPLHSSSGTESNEHGILEEISAWFARLFDFLCCGAYRIAAWLYILLGSILTQVITRVLAKKSECSEIPTRTTLIYTTHQGQVPLGPASDLKLILEKCGYRHTENAHNRIQIISDLDFSWSSQSGQFRPIAIAPTTDNIRRVLTVKDGDVEDFESAKLRRIRILREVTKRLFPCHKPGCGKTFCKINLLKKHLRTEHHIFRTSTRSVLLQNPPPYSAS